MDMMTTTTRAINNPAFRHERDMSKRVSDWICNCNHKHGGKITTNSLHKDRMLLQNW